MARPNILLPATGGAPYFPCRPPKAPENPGPSTTCISSHPRWEAIRVRRWSCMAACSTARLHAMGGCSRWCREMTVHLRVWPDPAARHANGRRSLLVNQPHTLLLFSALPFRRTVFRATVASVNASDARPGSKPPCFDTLPLSSAISHLYRRHRVARASC